MANPVTFRYKIHKSKSSEQFDCSALSSDNLRSLDVLMGQFRLIDDSQYSHLWEWDDIVAMTLET